MGHERVSGGGIGGAQMLRSAKASMVIGGKTKACMISRAEGYIQWCTSFVGRSFKSGCLL